MKNVNIIIESPKEWHKLLIELYLMRGFTVWVIEPFHAYHHQGISHFYPNPLPRYIHKMLKSGKINMLTADSLGSRQLSCLAADKAVKIVEDVFEQYKIRHCRVINYICDILNSARAEDIFKKEFCNQLAKFYSVNIMLSTINKKFLGCGVKIYPEINVLFYLKIRNTLLRAHQEIFADHVSFLLLPYLSGFIQLAKNNILDLLKLFLQALVSFLFIPCKFNYFKKKKKENYDFGITIVSPSRQLSGNKRGPDFIVDGEKICNSHVIYFPLLRLNGEERRKLHALGSRIYFFPDRGWGEFSYSFKWILLFMISLSRELFDCESIIHISHLTLSEFFRWQKTMERIEIKNLLTHADFGFLHIARNIALKHHNVRTWYFSDSINYLFNLQTENKPFGLRHPAWTYLYYDYFVTWEESLSRYFSAHPCAINKHFVVGCLWADQINSSISKNVTVEKNKFVIVVFDTTYSCNSITSYAEGIAFAKDILKLKEELGQDLEIIFKEKCGRFMHKRRDAILGDKITALYEKMDNGSGIKMCYHNSDSAEIMSQADMVISFPFTSTTFEALSANKPAIWHDPLAYYKDTIYAKFGGVITHSYEELKAKIMSVMNAKPEDYKITIPSGSPFMDPYCDGRAIERFRELLLSEQVLY